MAHDHFMTLDKQLARLEVTVAKGFQEQRQRVDKIDGSLDRIDGRLNEHTSRFGRLEDRISVLDSKLDVFAEIRVTVHRDRLIRNLAELTGENPGQGVAGRCS